MSLAERQPYKRISPIQQALRTILLSKTEQTYNREVVRKPNDGLDRAEQLAAKGIGTLILLPHINTKGEPPRAIALAMDNPFFGDREIIVPQGLHQYHGWYGPVGGLIGVTVRPIVIEDTVEYVNDHPEKEAKYAKHLTREGGAELLKKAFTDQARVLSKGGVDIAFPQGGRRPYLENVTSIVSSLLNRTNRPNSYVETYTILFMGVEIDGVEEYTEEGLKQIGLGINQNKGVLYRFTPGNVFTKQEFIAEAKKQGISYDEFTLQQLRLVSPPGYLPRN